jgi:hypothetical protein
VANLPLPSGLKGRWYILLAADYGDDEALIEAGPMAELMFVRLLARSRMKRVDGVLKRALVLRDNADLPGGPEVALAALVGSGRVTDDGLTVTVVNWGNYQHTQAQFTTHREKDAERKAARAPRKPAKPQAPEPGVWKGQAGVHADVDSLCDYLAAKITEITGETPAVTNNWRKEMRAALNSATKGKGDHRRVRACIDFAFADAFWRGVIVSPASLSKSWARIRQKAAADSVPPRSSAPQAGRPLDDGMVDDFADGGVSDAA